jgi:V/A-type H+-transporting ATPase subunit I
MFRPAPMLQVDVLLLQKDQAAVTRAMAEARLLHLRPLRTLPPRARSRAVDARQRAGELRAFAARLQQVMADLGVDTAGSDVIPVVELASWERWLAQLATRVARNEQRRRELVRLQERLGDFEHLVEALAGVRGRAEELRSLHFTHLSLGRLPETELERLQDTASRMAVFTLHRLDGEVLTAVLGVRRERARIEERLAEAHFRPLELSSAFAGSFQQLRERIGRLRIRLRQRLAAQEARRSGLRAEHGELLRRRLHSVRAESLLLEAQAGFDYAERVVLLGGWLPRRRFDDLQALLQQTTGGRFILRQTVARGEETPVQLANPAVVRPFQKILSIYGTPAFDEIEPTPLLAGGFVLMFGLMFGDLGQGLLLAIAGWLIRRRTRFREEGTIIVEVGFSAALFGLLFGSIFGREDLLPPLWFSPMHNIPLLMGTALAFGIALILASLVLRIVNGLRLEKGAAVLTDRYGVAGLVFYAGAVVTALLIWRQLAPAAMLFWLLVPLAAVFCHPFVSGDEAGADRHRSMLLAEGTIEVLETVLGFMANTFSFLRIAAFGLAHVGLFMAVYAMARGVEDWPLGALWVAAVHVAGNVVMVVLEGLVVSVQAVRLQFYEFFSKFFRGGGVPYRPLTLQVVTERRA